MARIELTIAVLGDLHGHIGFAMRLLRRWEREHNRKMDLALQVGDFGVWPQPEFRLDEAIRGFAERNPHEISFPDYTRPSDEATRFLAPGSNDFLSCPVVLVKGNHEYFHYLAELESKHSSGAIPVDYFQRFWYLPNGRVLELAAGERSVRVEVLGGVGRGPEVARFTQREIRSLLDNAPIDILLTHDIYEDALVAGIGSRCVKELGSGLQPHFFFAGHMHVDGQRLASAGNTEAYILNVVGFRHRGQLNAGCMGMLELAVSGETEFTFVSEPWQAEFEPESWVEF